MGIIIYYSIIMLITMITCLTVDNRQYSKDLKEWEKIKQARKCAPILTKK